MVENRIKELRSKANLTLRKLTSLIHVDYSYLSKIEKGHKNLTNEMSLKLAAFFSVDKNFVEGKKNYIITCHTSDLKRTFSLDNLDIQKYGSCYTSKVEDDNIVINIINKNIESELLKEKEATFELLRKIMNEKEIVDSMDGWAEINLLYAQAKIESLLNKKR